jgi:metal-responsive CopG/Arc/MetJ family transcriptional regulator
MRTLVDIPQDMLDSLDKVSASQKQSRAAVIREAIGEYLSKRRPVSIRDAFGMWADRDIDGLEYQNRMRDEW